MQVQVLDHKTDLKTFCIQSPTPLRCEVFFAGSCQVCLLPNRDLIFVRFVESKFEASQLEIVLLDHESNFQKILSATTCEVPGALLTGNNTAFFSFM